MKSALNRMNEICNKQELAIEFVSGLGGFLDSDARGEFARMVSLKIYQMLLLSRNVQNADILYQLFFVLNIIQVLYLNSFLDI